MTSEPRVIDVPGVPRFEVAPHHCFACGTLNEQGMGLELHVEPRRAWVETVLQPRFQGWDDIAHGGIIATILDEVMAWSLVGEDNWGVTARLQLQYRKPVPVQVPIRADGWMTGGRRRLIQTEASLTDRRDGSVLATATGTYVAADDERKRELRERYGWQPRQPARSAD